MHIPRTGGTSILAALDKSRGQVDRNVYNIGKSSINYAFHESYDKLIKACNIKKEILDKSFKFCFIRNVYSRLYSLSYGLEQRGEHGKDAFCKWITVDLKKKMVKREKYRKTNPRKWECNIFNADILRQWLFNIKGDFVPDWIGRYENLQEDFKKLCKILGIKHVQVPHLNSSNSIVGASRRMVNYNSKEYRKFYTPEARRLVEDLYAEEIEMFKFEF